MEPNSFNFPTENVSLPSKGLLYPETNPLNSGKIEMYYMTARHEDILTNQNYIRDQIVIDKLLQAMIATKINYDDLLAGDKDAILLSARILGYGKDYEFSYAGEEVSVDLTTLEEKFLDESLLKEKGKNEFEFKLPNTDNVITFRLLTHGDEKKIDAEIKGYKKINKNDNRELTTRLKYIIVSINGNYDTKTIREFVDNNFLASDSRAFREYYNRISPGINTKIKYTFSDGVEEDIDIPINVTFFWPDASI